VMLLVRAALHYHGATQEQSNAKALPPACLAELYSAHCELKGMVPNNPFTGLQSRRAHWGATGSPYRPLAAG
jgi:hypothetical protein